MSSSRHVTPSASISRMALPLVCVAGGEARHGVGQDVACAAGRAGRSPCAATISAWVESRPPETPITDPLDAGRLQPLHQPGDLDVVGLVAVLLEPRRIGRHEREALDLPLQPDIAMRRIELGTRRGGSVRRCPLPAAVVVEACPSACAPAAAGPGRCRRPRSGRLPGSARSRPAISPFSKIEAWPSQARSVVDSPAPGGGVEIGGDAARRTATGTAAGASPPCRW